MTATLEKTATLASHGWACLLCGAPAACTIRFGSFKAGACQGHSRATRELESMVKELRRIT